MKLWKRASGAIKDQNSLIRASLSRRTQLRNPDIEAAVIKATSHDPSCIDYRNFSLVLRWTRLSDIYFAPIIYAINNRMQKTRDWVVALKGVMLLHGVLSCRVSGAMKMGRIPFDFSSFKDKHSHPGKTWGYNAFIRAYYSYLDQKASFIYFHMNEAIRRKRLEDQRRDHDHEVENMEREKSALKQELVWIQGWQGMLDMLMQIRPQQDGMEGYLIIEVMDCLVIEIREVYGRLCNGIAGVLLSLYSAWIGKVEASMALVVLQNVNKQGEELALYYEFCRDIGVTNAFETPEFQRISDEDLRELEQIIEGVPDDQKMPVIGCAREFDQEEAPLIKMPKEKGNTKNRGGHAHHERKDSNSSLQTVVTDQWEVFEEEPKNNKAIVLVEGGRNGHSGTVKNNARVNPFVETLAAPKELPDLISFV